VYLASEPSVSAQRNKGIQNSSADYVFLCDDDMVLPADYVEIIMGYFHIHSEAGVVTGRIVESDNENHIPQISFKNLLWNFVFQLSVWASTEKIVPTFLNYIPLQIIKKFYQLRENTFSLAGWPICTKFTGPVLNTTIYGLGASIIRRDWLMQDAYDEILDEHGIGDNYGVALTFPGNKQINVLTDLYAVNQKTMANRLPADLAYYRRILALHYFMYKSERFNFINHLFLLWSLIGQLIAQIRLNNSSLSRATAALIKRIISGKNPYIIGYRQGQVNTINPQIDSKSFK